MKDRERIDQWEQIILRIGPITAKHCRAGIWSVCSPELAAHWHWAPGEQGRNNNESSNTIPFSLFVETNSESDEDKTLGQDT